ncbi:MULTISPECIES: hypothetical protein [unclassified Synechocystis]|uniref:hypothetical protein n=1 Tax=unclassified Synechocystis TaxID=2640012 RepID=UPI00042001E6|nr:MULTISPECIES: hypothetical protein [unclassified Synechocystis]AIE74681.1 hypothetical protein D082_21530 [Synechocystis sp. PCC 6714]MCT0253962.1 hypothetical protein [Synechocystis sp. CS-94]
MSQKFGLPRSRFLHDRPWYPLLSWLVLVSLGSTLGAVGGLVLGKMLHRLSYDYIVIPYEYQDWGLRFGLFVGTLLAAAQTVGRRSPLALGRPLLGLLAVATITGIGIGLGAFGSHILYQTGLWQPMQWQLPNPSRQAILVGAIMGRNGGAVVGITLTLLWLRCFPRQI